jgi:hypothetical protein
MNGNILIWKLICDTKFIQRNKIKNIDRIKYNILPYKYNINIIVFFLTVVYILSLKTNSWSDNELPSWDTRLNLTKIGWKHMKIELKYY